MSLRSRVVIVGGGTAGITVAAMLKNTRSDLDITLIEPSDKHYYQPIWTLVGAGEASREGSQRDEIDLMPRGVRWIKEKASSFEPEINAVVLESGVEIFYDALVVCPGIKVMWDGIKGLKESIGKYGVCSNYSFDYVSYTWDTIKSFEGGTAIFTHPSTPIKCGGAPQKICYLADDAFRRSGIRDKSRVVFASAQGGIFSVNKYAETLYQVIERKGIEAMFQHDLVAVDGEQKLATFNNMADGTQVSLSFEMIHVTPPMGPPDFVARSPLADQAGWVDVDKRTLQHMKFENIFALGDASNLPTSKTGAAIRKQAPVVMSNLLCCLENRPLDSVYDGYTSCPLVTGYGKLVLAEFDYDLVPKETFPFDQSKERYSMYVLKKHLLPALYWDGMLKGLS